LPIAFTATLALFVFPPLLFLLLLLLIFSRHKGREEANIFFTRIIELPLNDFLSLPFSREICRHLDRAGTEDRFVVPALPLFFFLLSLP